jgi:hypothetical protein
MVLSYLMGKWMWKPGEDFSCFFLAEKACWRTPDVCVDDVLDVELC